MEGMYSTATEQWKGEWFSPLTQRYVLVSHISQQHGSQTNCHVKFAMLSMKSMHFTVICVTRRITTTALAGQGIKRSQSSGFVQNLEETVKKLLTHGDPCQPQKYIKEVLK